MNRVRHALRLTVATAFAWWRFSLVTLTVVSILTGLFLHLRRQQSTEAIIIARLVAATTAGERSIEPRLTGGFHWSPYRARRVPRSDELDLPPAELADAANAAVRDSGRLSTASAHHTVALAYLLMGNATRAATELRQGTSTQTQASADVQAKTWSDLAAVLYSTAVEMGRPESFVDALVAADHALELAPKLPEARFNRALIVERLGLSDLAVTTWRHYLDVDSASPWALEAHSHLPILAAKRPNFREELEKAYDRIAGESAVALDLQRRFPQEVRTWGETEILGRWADAERRGDTAAAAKHLGVARTFGAQTQQHGDALLAEAVRSIERAGPTECSALAAGHDDFRRAQRIFMQMQPASADPLFARAAEEFERGGSPVAILARYFHANTVYEQRRTEEACATLDRLLESTPPRFRSARAQIQWQLGLCRSAEGRYGDALSVVSIGMATFEDLGESDHAATLRGMLAWLHELIGDLPEAWTLRLAALPTIGRSNTQITSATLSAVAQTAILRQDWAVAASFLNLELEAAQRAKNDIFIADALLRRALVRHFLDRSGDAGADLAAARAATAHIADAGMRSQLEGRLWWVDGVLAAQPAAKIAALGRAIDFHERNVRRMNLPALLYERAVAYRSIGRTDAAARDLDAAITELESHRSSLPRDARWGVFHAAGEIFDEAVDLALSAGRTDEAFRITERARAQTLLDTRKDSEAAAAPLPEQSVIVVYTTLPSRLVSFVVTRDGIHVTTNVIQRKELAEGVERLREAIRNENQAVIGESTRTLYDAVIGPIAPSIARYRDLVLVPDATLAGVPFAGLVAPNGHFLLEEHSVVIAPSARVYASAIRPPPAGLRHDALVVVNSRVPGRDPLPEAKREAVRIAQLYQARLLEGKEATVPSFQAYSRAAGMIHFSGHSLISLQRAEDTFLALSDSQGGEARLDVRQIAALQLARRPVVVLAACSTAEGRAIPVEGTMSAAHAFLAAGASSVIATLWPIADNESEEFFIQVHSHLLRGEPPAEALRNVQLESIRKAVPPSMWAAVQVHGN